MVRRGGVFVLLALLLLPLRSEAQTVAVAQLSGTVLDESGGALPGAEVTAQTDTAMTRFVITNESGGYVFTNLPVGPYKLAAKLSGFSVFEQTGIVLSVGDTRSVNISLKVGALTEVVSVTADATLVESRDVGVSRVVEHEQIVGLPLNGRSATQLIILAGGAVNVPGLTDNRQYPNAVSISVAGGTGNNAQYLVDGGYNNDPQNNTGNVMPFPTRSRSSASRAACAPRASVPPPVPPSTRSRARARTRSTGAPSSSAAYSFNSIPLLRAHRERRPRPQRRAQARAVGGTFGGPIIRDKLFFFGGVQITNERIAPIANDQIVPTAEVRRGDFRRIMSAACRGGTARTLGAPFVDNQISPSLFNPISLKIMSMLGAGSGAGSGRMRALRAGDPQQQRRAAMRVAAGLPDDEQAPSLRAVVLHEMPARAAVRSGPAEPADGERQRQRQRRAHDHVRGRLGLHHQRTS